MDLDCMLAKVLTKGILFVNIKESLCHVRKGKEGDKSQKWTSQITCMHWPTNKK